MCVQRRGEYKEIFTSPTIEEKYLIKFAEQVFPTAELLQLNTAGEPLMSRHFDLELDLAEKYQVKLDVITNGTLLSSKKDRLKRLCSNSKTISFSFDSPVKETYESIRINADFGQVVENMRLYHKNRSRLPADKMPTFNICMVLMNRNLDELLYMVRFAKEIGADHLSVSSLVVHTKEMEDESLDGCKQKVNQLLSEAKKLAKKINLSILMPALYDINSETESRGINVDKLQNHNLEQPLKRCFFLWERAYIDAVARIIVCCEPSHPIAGNLKDNDFQDIWNGLLYQKMRRTFIGGPLYTKCYNCAQSGYFSTLTL
jgi:MoaA/NifB/PqqE/SkfB family radical SAM enzyme